MLKIYKLGQLIVMNFRKRDYQDTLPLQEEKIIYTSARRITYQKLVPLTIQENKWNEYMRLGKAIKPRNNNEAYIAFQHARAICPYKVGAYYELAGLPSTTEEQREQYFSMILKLYRRQLETTKTLPSDIIEGFQEFRYFPDDKKYREELILLCKLYLARFTDDPDALMIIGRAYFNACKYSLAEEYLLKDFKNGDMRSCDGLAMVYHDMGKQDLSEKYLRLAKKDRPAGYAMVTIANYKEIKKVLDKHNIKLVCMQYPLRSVSKLKDIFIGEDQNIIFIDNEKIFKEALGHVSYKDLFLDQFAGDFGHCTVSGNKLIAKNLAKVILEQGF